MAQVFQCNVETLLNPIRQTPAVRSAWWFITVGWVICSMAIIATSSPFGLRHSSFFNDSTDSLLYALDWIVLASWTLGPPISFQWQWNYGSTLEGIEFERFKHGQKLASQQWIGFLILLLALCLAKRVFM
ncbi:MAG: hypothetical protein JWN70_5683 [Planctomycetaceae bacterium]|nr:hypothetical protein [Planctomycetaceae bacterium]